MLTQKNISYYETVKDSTPSRFIPVSEAYGLIRTGFISETKRILRLHKDGILDGFKTIDKAPYQSDKTQLLPVVNFAGNIDRSKKEQDFVHSGLINLDIDDDTPGKLKSFFALVKSGKPSFIEAAARSVSGFYTGAMWVNVRIEIPARLSYIPPRLRTLAGIDSTDKYKALEALHKAYHKALTYIFAEQAGITVGKSKDLKRARYISHDPDIFINPDAEVYTLKALEQIYSKIVSGEKRAHETNRNKGLNIDSTNAFEIAEEYVKKDGHEFIPGERHHFRLALGKKLNLLGVNEQKATDYILEHYAPKSGRLGTVVSQSYEKYKDTFGTWAHMVMNKRKVSFAFTLPAGKKLSTLSSQLIDIYREHDKIDLKAPTGSGKNYATVHKLAPALKRLNGCKTVIVCSLNSKAEKDARQYGLPYVTGELLQQSIDKGATWERIMKSDVFLCNQNVFPRVAKRLQQLNIFIDESQTLVDGMSYKPETVYKLWKAAERHGKTITLMSGTPKPYFAKLGFKRVEVKQEGRNKILLKVRARLKNKALTAFAHCEETDFNKKRLVIKIQSQDTIREVRDLLIKRNLLSPDEIIILYSDKEVKKSKHYQQFLNAGSGQNSFGDEVKVILCTSFINEGLDIYSSYSLEFVNIEQQGAVNVDELVQFADRWRTDQDKVLVSYFHWSDEHDPSPLNQVTVYEQTVEQFSEAAQALNNYSDIQKGFFAPSNQFKLGSNGYNEKFLYLDPGTDQYKVNELAIMGAAEELKIKHTTTERALEEIKDKFPYIELIDERDHLLNENFGAQADAQEVREKDEAKKNKVKEQLADLYDDNQEVLFQAVAMQTDDVQLKKAIDCHESRKDAVNDLIQAYPDAFGDYIKEGEQLVKNHLKLSRLKLAPNEIRTNLINECGGLISNQKLGVFIAGLRLHIALLFANYTRSEWKFTRSQVQVLTAAQGMDISMITKVSGAIEEAAEQYDRKLTSKQILKVVNDVYGRRKVKPYDTINKAVKLVNMLYHTERKTTNDGKDKYYQIGGIVSLSDYLTAHSVDANETVKKLHKYLETRQVVRQTYASRPYNKVT